MATLKDLSAEFADRGVFFTAEEALSSLAASPFMSEVELPEETEEALRSFYLSHWSYRR